MGTAILAACSASSRPAPSASLPVCGNGIVEASEECDDANATNSDGCLSTCRRPVNWVTSDPHVHSTGCSLYAEPADIARQLQAQAIQVGAVLVWGAGFGKDSALFTGRDHPLSTSTSLLHFDLEISHFQAAKTGHLMLLGLDSLEFSEDMLRVPESGTPVVEWARRQPRALVGMAHTQFWPSDGSFPVPPGGCCAPFETVVHAVRGRLDFLSSEKMLDEEPTPGTWRLWKALQNAGFRIPILGASDWACISDRFHERTPRTDVILDGPLTYENWLLAIKAGRTVMAAGVGNRLNLRVENRRLGEEVVLSSPGEVTVTIETAGAGAPVDVLVNGDVATTVPMPAGFQLAQVRVPLTKSSWISVRSTHAITSPVFVLVAGHAVRASPEDICYLWRSVDHLTGLVMSKRLYLYNAEPEALRAYAEAMSELQRRFTEAGGGVCRLGGDS
jgi:cysteine-rich repeat protein